MAYKKVYYGDIWQVTSAGGKKCTEWMQNLNNLNTGLQNLSSTNEYVGQSADSMKNYIKEVHGVIFSTLNAILSGYISRAGSYYSGYINCVDSGTGSTRDVSYTTIVHNEVDNVSGSVKKQIQSLINMAEQVSSDALNVRRSISDIVNISASPKNADLKVYLNSAYRTAADVDNKVRSFENSRNNDFAEIDRLIAQALQIINRQIGNGRMPVATYQSGMIGSMCDVESIRNDVKAVEDIVTEFENSEGYEEAMNLLLNRDGIIAEAEKDDRRWITWVATGVAIVGAIALTVATAGAAGVGACVLIGGLAGAATAAANKFADNYIENGSFTEGMDWWDFGTDVAKSAIMGMISGGMGALSTGSAIKQPIDKFLDIGSKTVVEEGVSGLLDMFCDLGEGIIKGKPGSDVISILEEDANEMVKDIISKIGGNFVESYLWEGVVDEDKKKIWEKIKQKGKEAISKGLTETALDSLYDWMFWWTDPNSSKNMVSVLKEDLKEDAQDMMGELVGGIISESVSMSGDIKNKTVKVFAETTGEVTSDTAEKVTEGITGRTIDYVYGDEKDPNKILGDIWEKDLNEGRTIVESTVVHTVEGTINEKDSAVANQLKKFDHDKDGKVEVVQIDDYVITKEDYDAAVRNAGKGVYKEKTVQEILGLPKDTDLSIAINRKESVNNLKKYSFSESETEKKEEGSWKFVYQYQ